MGQACKMILNHELNAWCDVPGSMRHSGIHVHLHGSMIGRVVCAWPHAMIDRVHDQHHGCMVDYCMDDYCIMAEWLFG